MTFEDRVREASHRLGTEQEMINYFQEKYPGKKVQKNGKVIEEWKGKLADAIQPFTKDKNGNPVKRASIMRRFQGGRQSSKRKDQTQEEYKALGDLLPMQPPKNGYLIQGTICLKYSEDCEERYIDIEVTGEAAAALAKSASPQLAINLYNKQKWDVSGAIASECMDEGCNGELDVIPLE